MHWHRLSSWVHYALLASSVALPALAGSVSTRAASADPPRESNGLTDVVQWDNYSLVLKGQRVFLQYVSLHPS